MSSWGRGLLQSDDDYKVAEELGAMFGCDILRFSESERNGIVQKMGEDGLLSRKLDKILSPQFVPPISHQSRPRMAVILVILAMRLGAKVDGEYMNLMHTLAPHLRNMFEQLQLVTALDEYKNNGTPWILGSKNREETEKAKEVGRTCYDAGDEFFYSGLGHSADEKPSSHTCSKYCWSCRVDENDLFRCTKCNMARYCSKNCQKHDWDIHRTVCEKLEPRSVDVPDHGATILEEHLSQPKSTA
ncbi:hypothetical protein PG985_006995 [Apiospora marii]|uniref:uncharacterized protein n=1 Tax=Apiospora marii TaxID=335849 RepID=UPI00313049FF